MNDRDYFVILNTQKGNVAMVDDRGELEFFKYFEEAEDAAKTSGFGSMYGWEVFELGGGLSNG